MFNRLNKFEYFILYILFGLIWLFEFAKEDIKRIFIKDEDY